MGLFDFLSKKPTPARIEKLEKRLLNQHHQTQVRQESLDELVAMETPEAMQSIIKRLGVNFQDTIVNEQEKRQVADVLVNRFGSRCIEPLTNFIRTEQTVSAAIRTLARLVDEDRLVTVLVETLRGHDPMDHRTIDARLQLVDALYDHEDPRIVDAVLPNLADHDDDVRIKTVETLQARVGKKHPRRDAVGDALVDALMDPEAAGRITRRVAEALRAMEINVGKRAMELSEFLPDGYAVGPKGTLIKR